MINRLSRLVVDPERFRDDAAEHLSGKGAGAVYTMTTDGRPLRDPTTTDREDLITRFYDPYAAHLSELCARLLDRFGAALIVDCHSFGSRPVAWAEDQSTDRPHICIGTDDHHTPNALAQSLLGIAANLGYDARRDEPYRGCYVPMRYYRKDPRVRSVLIEVRRDLYVDESTGELNDRISQTKALVDELLEACRIEAKFIARPTQAPIEVLAYDPAWAALYDELATDIAHVLGEIAIRIEHIGSTSVPGLRAKPIIDIQIEVSSLDWSYRQGLESLGYRAMPHHSDVTRHYFRETAGPRVHIHVFPSGSEAARDNLLFRDHLRRDAAARERYSAKKLEVVQRFGGDRAVYTDAKQPVVLEILREARDHER